MDVTSSYLLQRLRLTGSLRDYLPEAIFDCLFIAQRKLSTGMEYFATDEAQRRAGGAGSSMPLRGPGGRPRSSASLDLILFYIGKCILLEEETYLLSECVIHKICIPSTIYSISNPLWAAGSIWHALHRWNFIRNNNNLASTLTLTVFLRGWEGRKSY